MNDKPSIIENDEFSYELISDSIQESVETADKLTVEEQFETEIMSMLKQVVEYRSKFSEAKTSAKRKYFSKKIQHITPIIEQALSFYERFKVQKQATIEKKLAEIKEELVEVE